MFEPKNYIDRDNNYFIYRERNTNIDNPYFYLLTNDSFIGFPYIPNQLEYGYSSKYNRVTKVLGKSEDLQFLGNTIDSLNISNIIISSRFANKTWEQLIDKLYNLMLTDSAVAVCLQNRVIGSYVIESLKVIESGWIDGMPCVGNVSFQFINDNRETDFINVTTPKNYKRVDDVKVNNYDDGKQIELQPDETLSKLSFKQFGNVSLWRDIADLNPLFDLFNIDQINQNILVPGKLKMIDEILQFNNQLPNSSISTSVNNIDWLL